jgi:hypothetical protein
VGNPEGRPLRFLHQIARDLGRDGERSLTSTEQLGEIALLAQQRLQPVAVVAPPVARGVVFNNFPPPVRQQSLQPPVNGALEAVGTHAVLPTVVVEGPKVSGRAVGQ